VITIATTLLIFLAVLAVLILAHELGHFATARASGVDVEEFGFGFPPALLKIKRGQTVYSINLIPLGGFVKLAGEEDSQVPRSLAAKPVGTRLLILAAGSIMNVLLPIVLLSASYMVPRDVVVQTVSAGEVAAGSPAEKAGIQKGDVMVAINGRPVRNSGELLYNIRLHLGSAIELDTQRDGATRKVQITPRWNPPPGQGPIGVIIQASPGVSTGKESYPFWKAVPKGMVSLWETLVLFKNEILRWFIQGTAPQVAGPVGIAQMTGEVAQAGFSPLLSFAAFLSINLAIVNLFPLPALDGGRIAFVLLEWVRRGKRISAKREGLVHLVGFLMLMGLIVVVSYYDIMRMLGEGS
jgi:regulator of sigma E protease